MKELDLLGYSGLGLIILCKTGVTYTNQTGGYACNQSKEEGAYLPLDDVDRYIQKELYSYFFEWPWCGHCDEGIMVRKSPPNEETANYLDELLEDLGIKVDRVRMADSQEAWVYVEYAGDKCVLTWENSD